MNCINYANKAAIAQVLSDQHFSKQSYTSRSSYQCMFLCVCAEQREGAHEGA